ncbi:unnamed protein product [Rotaria sordida]|uniref:Uncharacterized protein n=1 Tax=Rotaria sordida TaxID=392033 RepID=A0A815C7P5_9BILA|nr:unnamed protein product [Rotaria sordida]CAF1279928.1 unnamed protein product [Rotaria sordida]
MNVLIDIIKCHEDYIPLDIKDEVKQVVKPDPSQIKIEKLENLISKLNSKLSKQLRTMLFGDCVKAAYQIYAMYNTLQDTCLLIRNAEQYRQSSALQQDLTDINDSLTEAKHFYELAKTTIDQISSQGHSTQDTLLYVKNNLVNAKCQTQCAQTKLESILKDINRHLQCLSFNKKNHSIAIGQTIFSFGISAVQFVTTPDFAITNLTKGLFGLNTSFQAANVIGHSYGFYWTQEEIQKLNELHVKMDKLGKNIKESFENIEHGMKTFNSLKMHIEILRDPALTIDKQQQ